MASTSPSAHAWKLHGTTHSHRHCTAYLLQVCRASLQLPSHDQDRLQGPEPKVVMVLLGQLLPGQLIQNGHLLGQRLFDKRW